MIFSKIHIKVDIQIFTQYHFQDIAVVVLYNWSYVLDKRTEENTANNHLLLTNIELEVTWSIILAILVLKITVTL